MEINAFLKFLETTSLNQEEKRNIKFLLDFLNNNNIPALSNKSYLFYGEPGIGKTYLAEKLLETINLPILYAGFSNINVKEKFNSLQELVKNLKKYKEFIIFLDDLDSVLELEEGEISDHDKKSLMSILEFVKRSKNKTIFICTSNSLHYLPNSFLDRIEVMIDFNLPSKENKLSFLNSNFKAYLNKEQLDYIANNTFGYNYRDLPEVIKLAYREGNKVISKYSIKKSLKTYKPTSLMGYDVVNGVNLNFKDVIGNNAAKKELRNVAHYFKNKEQLDKLDIKRSNLLMFHGPPGTGKTYLAKAFAGELGVPLINIKSLDMSTFFSIDDILRKARNFRNCVIFIDEVDKIIGFRHFGEEEGPVFADLNMGLDGASKNSEAIIILALNKLYRFGKAIQDRFLSIKFDFPNYDERKEFIKRKLLKSKIKKRLDFDLIARSTKGMSYRDIEKAWNTTIFDYVINKRLSTNVFLQTIREIKPEQHNTMFG